MVWPHAERLYYATNINLCVRAGRRAPLERSARSDREGPRRLGGVDRKRNVHSSRRRRTGRHGVARRRHVDVRPAATSAPGRAGVAAAFTYLVTQRATNICVRELRVCWMGPCEGRRTVVRRDVVSDGLRWSAASCGRALYSYVRVLVVFSRRTLLVRSVDIYIICEL